MAHHLHQIIGFPGLNANEGLIDRIKYCSSGRSHYLYTQQKKLMGELGIPFLDIYPITYISSFHHKPKDIRHYKPRMNYLMYNNFFAEQIDISPDFNWILEKKYLHLKKDVKQDEERLRAIGANWVP